MLTVKDLKVMLESYPDDALVGVTTDRDWDTMYRYFVEVSVQEKNGDIVLISKQHKYKSTQTENTIMIARDNHTFRRLPDDIEKAMEIIEEELKQDPYIDVFLLADRRVSVRRDVSGETLDEYKVRIRDFLIEHGQVDLGSTVFECKIV